MITASRPLHTGRLVLAPRDAEACIEQARIAERLRACGLIGPALRGRLDAFEIGERFLQLIGFTGCAVHVDAAPVAGSASFQHVTLHGPHPRPCLLHGRNTRAPRCPACGKGLADWAEQVGRRQSDQWGWEPELRCKRCKAAAPGWRWSWGRNGGFGRCFVGVEEIFPGEASPLPALFDALDALGIGAWHHFYTQD